MNTRKKIVWIAARACLILIFMMLATACRKLETLSSGNESGAYTAITPEEETQHAYDKYGPLGKEVFDNIAQMWIERTLEAEPDLRELMSLTYGSLSTLEELTQDILALPRNPIEQPTQAAPQETQATQPAEAQPQTPAPTKSQTPKPAPAETQPAPQETQTQQQPPAPTPAPEAPAPATSELIPGTGIQSTGNPSLDAELVEDYQRMKAGQVDTDKAVGNWEHDAGYTDQGADLKWN